MQWQEHQDSLCSGCSKPRHESFDPHGPEYEVTPLRCRACEAREAQADRFRSDDHSSARGLYFAVAEKRGET